MLPKNIAIVFAGGKGTRMNSALPKVLHKIGNKPMIDYTLSIVRNLPLQDLIVVVGYQAEIVKKHIELNHKVKFARQKTPLGTGDALKTGLNQINSADFGAILVLNGDDSAFYNPETLSQFLKFHVQNKNKISMLILETKEFVPLGTILTDKNNNFEGVMPHHQFLESGHKTQLVNCGAYVFDSAWLQENIDKLNLNYKGEYFITEFFDIAKDQGVKIGLFKLTDPSEWMSVNTQEELQIANKKMEEKLHVRK